MNDLVVALGIMSGISAAVLLLTIYTTRSLTRREATGVGTVMALLMVLYLQVAWKSSLLVHLLPFSSIAILSNWFPIAACFLAGVTWTHGYGSKLRRVLFGTAVIGISSYSMVAPVLGNPPNCEDVWDENGVCRATSPFTCSPAAAATLLSHYDVHTQESEMAQLCLTRRGTTWQGLYRGLRLKLNEQPPRSTLPRRIDVLECSWQELKTRLKEPAILSVGLQEATAENIIYVRRWGWQPGVLHSVVFLRFVGPDLMLIADPSVGLEFWSIKDLEMLYRGRAIRLVHDDVSKS